MKPGDICVMRLCPDVCVENAAVLSHRDLVSILESKTIVSPCFNLQREFLPRMQRGTAHARGILYQYHSSKHSSTDGYILLLLQLFK